MAWIAKKSGSMEIERRDEPYLTDAMKSRLRDEVLPRYETKLAACLPTLHEIQHEYGWIPPQALEEVAAFLELTPSMVYDTASFYEEFWLKRKGRHVVAVCRSIACEVCDHHKITDVCREKLGIEVGETTDDGKFTLVELECIGACGGAPAVLVDEDLHEFVTEEQMGKLIDGVKD
ncbi:MAG: NADH-quinone oxidoreductase subunit NuoE [Planctomycetota bacterium]|nr:NADH-quinone oxidoreductase subunit NuoE [Planctomycetota bacterium]